MHLPVSLCFGVLENGLKRWQGGWYAVVLYGMLGMEGGHVIGGCNDGIIICSRFTGSPPGSAAASQMVILELVVNRLLFKLIVQYREDLNFCDDQQNEKFTLL